MFASLRLQVTQPWSVIGGLRVSNQRSTFKDTLFFGPFTFDMSLDVLLGYTGLPSLGQAAYFGVAAYAVALLATERQVGLLGCAAAGIALAAVTAAVFGVVAIRARGTYFLMITLALGMVVWGLAFRWVSLTKGDNGVSGVPRPELGALSLSAPLPFFYFALVTAAVSWTLLGLLVMRWIVEAIKAINGKVEDREAFLAALKKVELKDFPRGPVVIDKWGNPVQNIYVRKVERVGGQLQNSVIFTYPAVSQFWKYNPDEFLKQPLYTRDYPPCKHC